METLHKPNKHFELEEAFQNLTRALRTLCSRPGYPKDFRQQPRKSLTTETRRSAHWRVDLFAKIAPSKLSSIRGTAGPVTASLRRLSRRDTSSHRGSSRSLDTLQCFRPDVLVLHEPHHDLRLRSCRHWAFLVKVRDADSQLIAVWVEGQSSDTVRAHVDTRVLTSVLKDGVEWWRMRDSVGLFRSSSSLYKQANWSRMCSPHVHYSAPHEQLRN